MKAVNPKGKFEYIDEIDDDAPENEKTIFVWCHLTTEQRSVIDDAIGIQTDEGFVVTAGKSNLLAIHMGLLEVKNLCDEEGNPVELKRDQTKSKNSLPGVGRPWSMASLDRIRKDVLDRLAKVIKEADALTEAEAKN